MGFSHCDEQIQVPTNSSLFHPLRPLILLRTVSFIYIQALKSSFSCPISSKNPRELTNVKDWTEETALQRRNVHKFHGILYHKIKEKRKYWTSFGFIEKKKKKKKKNWASFVFFKKKKKKKKKK